MAIDLDFEKNTLETYRTFLAAELERNVLTLQAAANICRRENFGKADAERITKYIAYLAIITETAWGPAAVGCEMKIDLAAQIADLESLANLEH